MKIKNSEKPLNIVILNSHTSLNSGDAGILISHIQFLRKNFGNVKITVASRTPVLDSEIYKSYDIILLPPIIPTPFLFSFGSNKIRENLINIFSLSSRFRLIREIKRCDLVIACGGSNFFSNRRYFPGPMFFQNYFHVLLSILFRKPLFFSPQSFGPFSNKAALFFTKSILKSRTIKKIWAREEISFNTLLNLLSSDTLCEICPDMAFYLDLETENDKRSVFPDLPGPIVALTLRSWSFPESKNSESRMQKQEQYLVSLVDACKSIYEDFNGSIVFISSSRAFMRTEDDRIVIQKIVSRLNNIVPRERIYCPEIEDNTSPFHMASLLSSVDLVIATRFHPAIFAILSGVPVISISYHHKCNGIMKMMKLDKFSLPISNLKTGDIINLVEEILINHDSIKKKIKVNCEKLRTEIETKLYQGFLPVINEIRKKRII